MQAIDVLCNNGRLWAGSSNLCKRFMASVWLALKKAVRKVLQPELIVPAQMICK
jgi:hypothetical protein